MGIIPIIKHAVNSTLGTGFFMPLDKMISSKAGTADMLPLNELIENKVIGGEVIFRESGTFQVPDGVEVIQIIAAGGGGGAAPYNRYNTYFGMSGASGGCCISEIYNVRPKQEIEIVIGRGGSQGKDGGATLVGDLVTVAGGIGLDSNNATINSPSAGNGSGAGGISQGDKNTAVPAEDGLFGKGGVTASGAGGGGSYGKGGDGGGIGESGKDGVDGGGGGGRGKGSSSTSIKGGKGGDGIVIIRWGGRIKL